MSVRCLRRCTEVEARTGLRRRSLATMRERSIFPRPRRIGQRAVAWNEATLENWRATRAEANPHDVHVPGRGS